MSKINNLKVNKLIQAGIPPSIIIANISTQGIVDYAKIEEEFEEYKKNSTAKFNVGDLIVHKTTNLKLRVGSINTKSNHYICNVVDSKRLTTDIKNELSFKDSDQYTILSGYDYDVDKVEHPKQPSEAIDETELVRKLVALNNEVNQFDTTSPDVFDLWDLYNRIEAIKGPNRLSFTNKESFSERLAFKVAHNFDEKFSQIIKNSEL